MVQELQDDSFYQDLQEEMLETLDMIPDDFLDTKEMSIDSTKQEVITTVKDSEMFLMEQDGSNVYNLDFVDESSDEFVYLINRETHIKKTYSEQIFQKFLSENAEMYIRSDKIKDRISYFISQDIHPSRRSKLAYWMEGMDFLPLFPLSANPEKISSLGSIIQNIISEYGCSAQSFGMIINEIENRGYSFESDPLSQEGTHKGFEGDIWSAPLYEIHHILSWLYALPWKGSKRAEIVNISYGFPNPIVRDHTKKYIETSKSADHGIVSMTKFLLLWSIFINPQNEELFMSAIYKALEDTMKNEAGLPTEELVSKLSEIVGSVPRGGVEYQLLIDTIGQMQFAYTERKRLSSRFKKRNKLLTSYKNGLDEIDKLESSKQGIYKKFDLIEPYTNKKKELLTRLSKITNIDIATLDNIDWGEIRYVAHNHGWYGDVLYTEILTNHYGLGSLQQNKDVELIVEELAVLVEERPMLASELKAYLESKDTQIYGIQDSLRKIKDKASLFQYGIDEQIDLDEQQKFIRLIDNHLESLQYLLKNGTKFEAAITKLLGTTKLQRKDFPEWQEKMARFELIASKYKGELSKGITIRDKEVDVSHLTSDELLYVLDRIAELGFYEDIFEIQGTEIKKTEILDTVLDYITQDEEYGHQEIKMLEVIQPYLLRGVHKNDTSLFPYVRLLDKKVVNTSTVGGKEHYETINARKKNIFESLWKDAIVSDSKSFRREIPYTAYLEPGYLLKEHLLIIL